MLDGAQERFVQHYRQGMWKLGQLRITMPVTHIGVAVDLDRVPSRDPHYLPLFSLLRFHLIRRCPDTR